eukprot:scaffold76_cov88-Skeletonema_marinoi.AAC.1
MARFAIALALLPVAALAFSTTTSLRTTTTTSLSASSKNAQDPSRSAPSWTQARSTATYNDDFDAPILANPQSGTTVLENQPVVDDECYMGANLDAEDCVDFDPPKQQANQATPATYSDDFDAPIPANPQSGTTVLDHEPVVDDECYMGANGDFDDCVDFDPPKQANDWTNVMDTPRGQKARDLPGWAKKSSYNDDFDAPIPANPQSGTTVLDHEPVVDDECYMGANGDFDDCVDFDPPKQAQQATPATYSDDFDAPIPANPQSGTTVLENQPVVDDECYMGANLDAEDCVDFDPPKQAQQATPATYSDDFDAPIPANPQSGTTVLDHEPVVDDECYMGANGDFDDCVDFDPPKQANDWTNVMDTPRGQKARDLPGWAKKSSGTYNDDFDAPIPANPQSGTTVLENEPVVDDECYMGAKGDFGDCVDFDPPKQA